MPSPEATYNAADAISRYAPLISAIGSILVAILAIWGDKIRALLAGPKLEIEPHNLEGHLTYRGSGAQTWYYHLKVVNKRQWSPAKRVRVICTKVFKETSPGNFEDQRIIVPFQMVWSPPNFHELLPTIKNYDVFDLGSLDQGGAHFELAIYVRFHYFPGYIKKNERYRIGFDLEADNFHSKRTKWHEIFWDGQWDKDQNKIRSHLTIKELHPATHE